MLKDAINLMSTDIQEFMLTLFYSSKARGDPKYELVRNIFHRAIQRYQEGELTESDIHKMVCIWRSNFGW